MFREMAMPKINDYTDAEREFGRWLMDKYPTVKKVNFKKVSKDRERELWTIEGEMETESGLFKSTWQPFKLEMNTDGEIVGYELVSEEDKKT